MLVGNKRDECSLSFRSIVDKGRRKLERQTARINHERNRARTTATCTTPLPDGASNYRLQVVVDIFRWTCYTSARLVSAISLRYYSKISRIWCLLRINTRDSNRCSQIYSRDARSRDCKPQYFLSQFKIGQSSWFNRRRITHHCHHYIFHQLDHIREKERESEGVRKRERESSENRSNVTQTFWFQIARGVRIRWLPSRLRSQKAHVRFCC